MARRTKTEKKDGVEIVGGSAPAEPAATGNRLRKLPSIAPVKVGDGAAAASANGAAQGPLDHVPAALGRRARAEEADAKEDAAVDRKSAAAGDGKGGHSSGPSSGGDAPLFDNGTQIDTDVFRAGGCVELKLTRALDELELTKRGVRLFCRLVDAQAAELPDVRGELGEQEGDDLDLPFTIERSQGRIVLRFEEEVETVRLTKLQCALATGRIRAEARVLRMPREK